jgi:hypothetical protein
MSSGFTDKPGPPAKPAKEDEITYTLTPEDFVTFYMFFYDKARCERRATIFGQLVGLLLAALVIPPLFGWIGGVVGGFAGLLAILVLLVIARRELFPGRERKAYRKLMVRSIREGQKGGAFRFPRRDRIELTGDGFTEFNVYDDDSGGVTVTERRETCVSWHAVETIDIADDHLFITVRDKGWLIVPRRAFPDEQAFLRFAGTVRRYYDTAAERTRFGDKIDLAPSADVRITGFPPH